MINKSSNLVFMSILFISVLISISANSWFVVWMGMEINMMAFLPLMMEQNNNLSKESALTYFLTQTIASMIFIMSMLMTMIGFSGINSTLGGVSSSMMMSALMIKSGISPFHFWMPKVMEGLTWNKCLILMTWQKIIPLMVMSNIIEMNSITITAMILSIIFGAIGGLNQTSLRKLMAYSSISNNGWMMAAMMMSELAWLLYFSFYSIMTMIMTISMNTYKNYHMNQLISMNETTYKKYFLLLNMLSISGLPPMMGFIPKWIIIQYSMSNIELTLMGLMVMLTLITIFYYLRLMFSVVMLSSTMPKWNIIKNKKINMMTMVLSNLSIMGLTLITIMISLY
nr:NADH dehydrogenase subunit 2 [Peruphasma schultei]